jgi:hypothetical protein
MPQRVSFPEISSLGLSFFLAQVCLRRQAQLTQGPLGHNVPFVVPGTAHYPPRLGVFGRTFFG